MVTCLASRLSGVATLLSMHKAATARVNEYFMLMNAKESRKTQNELMEM